MSTAIQRRRGTAAQHASFTGLPGEITIDTTDNRAVVHDGSTAGGHPMAKESEAGIGATVGATEKTTPVDADIFGIADSADSNALKKVSFSNMAAYVAGKLGAAIAALTGKTTPVDADVLLLSDSAASSASKKLTWANLVTGVGTGLGAAIAALTAKTTPVSADTILLSDSAASNASKKVTWANIVAGMITDLGASISGLTAKSTPVSADNLLLSDSAASNASKKVTVAALKTAVAPIGQQTIFVPAGAMTPATTNGAARGSGETSVNKVMRSTLDFDASTEEFAQFGVQMPKGWDESTLIAQFIWSHASTTTNFGVVWGIEAVAFADSDALDTAWGTEVATADTGGTTDDIFISPESTAITVAGSPGNEEYVMFRITRVVGNASDTMAVDARLHGVKIHYTTSAATDD